MVQSIIEAPCSMLQGIFDPQGSTIYSNRSLTPQQATGNTLAPGFSDQYPRGLPSYGDWMCRIWDVRQDSVLFIGGPGLPARKYSPNGRTISGLRPQTAVKKAPFQGLFDGNALPFSALKYTRSSSAVKRKRVTMPLFPLHEHSRGMVTQQRYGSSQGISQSE
jgi:hypothetical protein